MTAYKTTQRVTLLNVKDQMVVQVGEIHWLDFTQQFKTRYYQAGCLNFIIPFFKLTHNQFDKQPFHKTSI